MAQLERATVEEDVSWWTAEPKKESWGRKEVGATWRRWWGNGQWSLPEKEVSLSDPCACLCVNLYVCASTWSVLSLWSLTSHCSPLVWDCLEFIPKQQRKDVKSITVENKSKSSIWKPSETMQTERSCICCIVFITVFNLLPPPPPGPGPGRYALPPTVGFINHDFTKPSSPTYSFRSRTSSASKFLQELVARWKWNVCVMLCSDYSSDTKHQRPTQPWLHSSLHSNQGFTHLFGKQCFGPKEIKTIQNYSFEKKKTF